MHFLENVFRLATFIFFSFTYSIVITKLEKVFKNIDLKKYPGRFTVLALPGPQNSKYAGIFF